MKDYRAQMISNHFQAGGIETAILDNGPGKGARIAWINTGSGLRYKVVIDRAMDIADAFYNQFCLSWISRSGITLPNPAAAVGTEWLRAFGGGLVATCGLSHIGDFESDEYGTRGIHGNISNQPAEVVSITQPDINHDNFNMSISGIVRESGLFGPHLVLRRTISSTLGEPVIRIHDEISNDGNKSVPHMMLYHFNFGWPLADEGTLISWEGSWHSGGREMDDQIFREGGNFKTCPGILEQHEGFGEAVGYIDIKPDQDGNCKCGMINKKLNLACEINFRKKQLPWLINWQHWSEFEYVTGLEPATNPPIGQTKARRDGTLIFLSPGETRTYDIEFSVCGGENDIIRIHK